MSYLGAENKDAIEGENDYSTGPLVGFMDNFNYQYAAEARAASAFSVEVYMAKAFDEQRKAALELGVEGLDIGVLSNGLDIMEYYNNDAPEPELADIQDGIVKRSRLSDYDRRVAALKEQYPTKNFRTTREMSDYVKAQAKEAEQKAALARPTALGSVGGFFGGAVAGIDPTLNTFNFLTLPVGFGAKTVATRIGMQAAGQGGIEAINQLTGVQRERKALGLNYGVADAAMRIGGAAAGGAALQGIGEAAAFGLRKWFAHAPNDPAPPIPVEMQAKPPAGEPPRSLRTAEQEAVFEASFREANGSSRPGAMRSQVDLEHVRKQLDAWDGEKPINIRPPDLETATRFPRAVDQGFEPTPVAKTVFEGGSLEEFARKADPQLFVMVDKLQGQQAVLRSKLDTLRPSEAQANASLKQIDDRIEELSDKVKNKRFTQAERDAAGGRTEAKAKAKAEIEQLKVQRDAEFVRLTTQDTPDMKVVRDRIVKNDEKLRDYAPLLSRAYARAQDKWGGVAEYNDLFRRKVTQGRMPTKQELDEIGTFSDVAAAASDIDRMPMLARASEVRDRLREDADAVDTMAAIVSKDAEVIDEKLVAFRENVNNILQKEGMGYTDRDGSSEFMLNGIDHKFKLTDGIAVPVENGDGVRNITVRELLEELRDAELDAKAVETCSL